MTRYRIEEDIDFEIIKEHTLKKVTEHLSKNNIENILELNVIYKPIYSTYELLHLYYVGVSYLDVDKQMEDRESSTFSEISPYDRVIYFVYSLEGSAFKYRSIAYTLD